MLLMLTLAACTGGTRQEQMEKETTVAEMDWHFERATTARDALVAGQLDEVKTAAKALADRLPVEQLPPETMSHQKRLKVIAMGLSVAPDVEKAGELMGELTTACAGCHASQHAKPISKSPDASGSASDLNSEMAQHQAAIAGMWLSLVFDDANSFAKSAASFDKSALFPEGIAVDARNPEAVALEVRAHDLARLAAREDAAEQRARMTGRLFATCASCHALIRSTGGAE